MPNYNPETGIPYGTIYAQHVPYLWEDIATNGDDLTFEGMRQDVRDRIVAAFETAKEEENLTSDKLSEILNDQLNDYHYAIHELIDELDLDAIVESIKEGDSGMDAELILEDLENCGLWDCPDDGEHDYAYSYETPEGFVELEMTHLGGAALIYVEKSPYVARCRGCSPCVPGAGDLDSPDEDGMLAYCLPPEEMPEEWDGKVLLLREINA